MPARVFALLISTALLIGLAETERLATGVPKVSLTRRAAEPRQKTAC
jgi:hypothetical protein